MNLAQILPARKALTHFVQAKAKRLHSELGFGYVEKANAPADFLELKAAWARSQATREAFPVYMGASDTSIYMTDEANWAFRFWHDVLHIEYNLDFCTSSEITLGGLHVDAVAKQFGPDSTETLLMLADTVGQTQYYARTGTFPENQMEFVLNYVNIYEALHHAA